jgi:anti-sigma-K factor RskA
MYDDERDALAAEYVLGTLSADEREQTEALLAIDPGFAEIVRVWERRLGELNVMVEAVEPPADVWNRIRAGIGGAEPLAETSIGNSQPVSMETAPQLTPEAMPESSLDLTPEPGVEIVPDLLSQRARDHEPVQPLDLDNAPRDLDDDATLAALASSLLPPEPEPPAERQSPLAPPTAAPPKAERSSADIIYLSRKVRRWRGFTVAMSAIAALLAVYVGVSQFAPGLIPLGRQSQPAVAARTQPPGSRPVAVLQQDPTAPAFLLTLDPQNRTMTVRRVTASADADRSYELWLIPNNSANPRSLGLVGGGEFTTRPIPANFDVDAMRTASYAVSLEPAGGSKSGAPSGPILFRGKMVESLPGAPAPG